MKSNQIKSNQIKSNQIKSILLSLTVVILIAACSENLTSISNTREEIKDYSIKNGMLKFDNSISFENIISAMNDDEISKIQIINDLKNNGISPLVLNNTAKNDFLLKGKLNKSITLQDEDADLPLVEDELFASVLNENGMVLIDNVSFRITRNYIFWAPETLYQNLLDDDILNELINKNVEKRQVSQIQSSTIGMLPIERLENEHQFEDPDIDAPSTGGPIYWTNVNFNKTSTGSNSRITHTYTSSTERRAVAESWNTNWYIYASIGSETINEKKTMGIWFDAPCRSVTVEGIASVKYKTTNKITGEEIEEIKEFRAKISDSNNEHAKLVYDWKIPALGNKSFLDNIKNMVKQKPFEIISISANHYVENIVGTNGWKISMTTTLSK